MRFRASADADPLDWGGASVSEAPAFRRNVAVTAACGHGDQGATVTGAAGSDDAGGDFVVVGG